MDPPTPPAMSSSQELLEETFKRVEQDSERRVLDRDKLSQGDAVGPGKHRKKPTVSISQFGKQEEQGGDGHHSQASSPLSAVATKSTFYHTLANPSSVDSFLSGTSRQETHYTEEEHEIQVERIVGRQSLPKTVGALLPRRLTRAQSQVDYVSVKRGMVIDVSVETTIELSRSTSDLHASTAYATRPSRPRSATVVVERAKDLARKLRRKSHRI